MLANHKRERERERERKAWNSGNVSGEANEKRRDDHEGYHKGLITFLRSLIAIVGLLSRAFHTYSQSELPLSSLCSPYPFPCLLPSSLSSIFAGCTVSPSSPSPPPSFSIQITFLPFPVYIPAQQSNPTMCPLYHGDFPNSGRNF